MKKIETGGPAFPAEIGPPSDGCMVQTGDRQWLHHGMTLRDYFAAKAMQGLLAHPNCKPVGKGFQETTNFVVSESYAMADAMLEARK